MSNSVLITQSGLEQLTGELRQLQEIRRPKLVERLATARSMGDLSENSDYTSAKEDLAFFDGRIAELEGLVKNAKVVRPQGNDQVDIGHQVTVQVNGRRTLFHIVGEWEADPARQKISHSSPLGRSLLGRKVGDKVEVEAPVGKLVYTIIAIG